MNTSKETSIGPRVRPLGRRLVGVLGLALLGLAAPSARADQLPCRQASEIAPEAKELSRKLEQRASDAMRKADHEEAARTFVAAARHSFDARHYYKAGTQFYFALMLLEAHEYLQRAIDCGTLDKTDSKQARIRLDAVARRLARLQVSVDEPGATVSLNDEVWFQGPGTRTRILLPGQYSVRAEKPGYKSERWTRALEPGHKAVYQHDFETLDRLPELEVHVDAPGATVFLDDEVWFQGPGSARKTALDEGQHQVRVEKSGHVAEHRSVRLQAGQVERIALTLQRLPVIEVRGQPGATLFLNGEPWFVSEEPVEEKIVAHTGRFSVQVEKPGHGTVHRRMILEANRRYVFEPNLLTDREIRVGKRRWDATWKPWAVVGAGAGTLLVGGLLSWRAQADFTVANSEYGRACGPVEPLCTPADPGLYRRARWERGLAIGAYAAGGTALVVGAALVLLNRPGPLPVEEQDRSRLEVVPMALQRGAGVSGRWQF